jgi:hypothetical protein
MKRFWKDVAVEPFDGALARHARRPADPHAGRRSRSRPERGARRGAGGRMARAGRESRRQALPLRDLADYAIDHVRADRAAAIADLLRYAETDTLCYRADPDEPLYRRQLELWEPLVDAFEARHGVRLERVSGIVPPPAAQRDDGQARRSPRRPTTISPLAALATLAPLAASLTVALARARPGRRPDGAVRRRKLRGGLAGRAMGLGPRGRTPPVPCGGRRSSGRWRFARLARVIDQPTQAATSEATWLARLVQRPGRPWRPSGSTRSRGFRSDASAPFRRASPRCRRSAPRRCRWPRRKPMSSSRPKAWSPRVAEVALGRPPGAAARIVSDSSAGTAARLFDPTASLR